MLTLDNAMTQIGDRFETVLRLLKIGQIFARIQAVDYYALEGGILSFLAIRK
jgi:hypothetical protein